VLSVVIERDQVPDVAIRKADVYRLLFSLSVFLTAKQKKQHREPYASWRHVDSMAVDDVFACVVDARVSVLVVGFAVASLASLPA
jgi:hypothetical protein